MPRASTRDIAKSTAASVRADFTLPSHLTIETAEPLTAALKEVATSATGLTLDASGVEVMTSPGLQLMISLSKTMRASARPFRIVGLKEPLQRLLTQAGLDSFIHPLPTQE